MSGVETNWADFAVALWFLAMLSAIVVNVLRSAYGKVPPVADKLPAPPMPMSLTPKTSCGKCRSCQAEAIIRNAQTGVLAQIKHPLDRKP